VASILYKHENFEAFGYLFGHGWSSAYPIGVFSDLYFKKQIQASANPGPISTSGVFSARVCLDNLGGLG